MGLCLGILATKIRERKSPLFHPSGRFGGLQLEVSFLQSHTVITHPQNITPQQSGLHSLRCGSSPLPFPLFFSCCFMCVWFFWSMVGKQLCQDIGHKFIEAFRILLWIDGRNLCTSLEDKINGLKSKDFIQGQDVCCSNPSECSKVGQAHTTTPLSSPI